MSSAVRQLTVLGEFKPFGLIAEALDGKTSPAEHVDADEEKYDYFLFDPDITRDRDEALFADHDLSTPSHPSSRGDHELFIRGNRIIWSSGSRIHKRYSSSTPVLMACWCHMDSISEALLCVLQIDSLSIYSASGEMVCIPLPNAISSIWSLPFGLLLQRATDGVQPIYMPSSSSSLNARDLSRPNKEYMSCQYASNLFSSLEHAVKEDVAVTSSHLILKHPLEEPQVTYVEDRGHLTTMKDFYERTIWTSDIIPLMASYHKGNMKHSVWLLEIVHPEHEFTSASQAVEAVSGPFPKLFSLRRIWQGKCSQSAASKVFMATDFDGVPIICFLIHEQKMLLSVRLLVDEGMDDIPLDIRAHVSWSIPAIAAVPAAVTRPRSKVGDLPFSDILVLASENNLLLYSGKQCLCKYVLPNGLGGSALFTGVEHSESISVNYDLKITGVADPVAGRINVLVDNGQVFRCILRRNPSSSLTNDCIAAMADGLHSSFYSHFVVLLWENSDPFYLSSADSHVDLEWESFKNVMIRICQKCGSSFLQIPCESHDTSWNFLIGSKFHKNYHQLASVTGRSFATILDAGASDHAASCVNAVKSQETSFYVQFLIGALDSLHALYESLKLDNLRKHDVALLVDLLCYIAASLGEGGYMDHYIRDFPYVSLDIATVHSSTRSPPSLFRWFERCLQSGCKLEHANDLPHMICKDKGSAVSWARKIVAFYSLLLGAERNERRLSSGVYCDIARGSANTAEEFTVLAMVAERFSLQQLDLLPAGVSLPLRHALDRCRESPPTDWPAGAYVLVGREDLAMGRLGFIRKHKEHKSQINLNLISICTPYMLPLQPVTIPSSVSEMMQFDSIKVEDTGNLDRSAEDGMEHMFNSSTKLQYGRDLRLNEVRRLLCSARPVAIQTPVNPSASDQDLQQHQLWNLAQRTSALPFGRGGFTLATIYTLLTEALVIPKLIFSGRLPAQQNATVNLDPNMRNVSELGSWPEFHNGVAAGLTLAPFQGKMSRTWIQYNKPEEPNVTHAGVILALGLHGHLCALTISDVYKYLAQEHETTIVGLLLGLAASHRGTMHPAITKMLYVHITSQHPSSFPEIELPTLLQSAALLSIGLLYEGSAHPSTMKILLDEIGRRSAGDNVLEREGYAVAAGSAVGLVALGRGMDSRGFMEAFVDRLFEYVGGKEVYNERTLSTRHMVDEHKCSASQMMDGTQINVDVTAPGATIALALMFMKTESVVTASQLSIPATHFDLQYVRPDFIMLRIIARNLIMWSSMRPSMDWIDSQIPEIVKIGISRTSDETADIDGIDIEALVQAYVNIIAGACISLGLKFAGTRNGDAQELLYCYAVYFLNEIKPVHGTEGCSLPKGLSKHVDRGTMEICLHLIVLSLSVVMAGSGHLQTFRLLRFLRSRGSVDGHINYGIQMAVSLAIGFLFVGGGMQTFSTSNSAIAALLISLYPRLPTGPNDNRCHLQAFRHLYVIATESRWVQTVDVDTGLPVYAPLEVTVVETENFAETTFCEVTPCILPERALLKTVQVCGPRYWPQLIHLTPEEKPWWRSGERNNPFDAGIIYIKRKVGVCSYVDDPTGCQSLLLRAMHKVSDAPHLSGPARTILDDGETTEFMVDQLVGTFSADPSLIAFAQVCCDPTWNSRSDTDFQEFCSRVLLECVSKDRPALLQVYLSFYTLIGSMWEQMKHGHPTFNDSLFISSIKIAIAYNEAIITGRLINPRGSIIQPTFIESLGKHVEEILNSSWKLKDDLHYYLEGKMLHKQGDKIGAMLLSWYLQWFGIPPPNVVKLALDTIKPKITRSSGVPLLCMLLPTTRASALGEIDKMKFS